MMQEGGLAYIDVNGEVTDKPVSGLDPIGVITKLWWSPSNQRWEAQVRQGDGFQAMSWRMPVSDAAMAITCGDSVWIEPATGYVTAVSPDIDDWTDPVGIAGEPYWGKETQTVLVDVEGIRTGKTHTFRVADAECPEGMYPSTSPPSPPPMVGYDRITPGPRRPTRSREEIRRATEEEG